MKTLPNLAWKFADRKSVVRKRVEHLRLEVPHLKRHKAVIHVDDLDISPSKVLNVFRAFYILFNLLFGI
jgi:hypothetical protein